MKNFLLVVLSAGLMSFGWLGPSGLPMLVGLVPLLAVASRVEKPRTMAGLVALFVGVWYGLTVWWVWNATPVGPIAAAIFAYIYIGIPLLVWWWVSRRAPRVLGYVILVAGWMVGEWVYATNQASFPWLAVGSGFARDVWAVQWMEFTGQYGGALWVLLANIFVFERRWRAAAATVALPIAISLTMYWTFREPAQTARVTVVQPNVDAWDGVRSDAELTSLVGQAPRDADFVLLPESAMNGVLPEAGLAVTPSLIALRQASPPHATLVTGATTYRGDVHFNSAIAVAPTGGITVYHKAKMVPGAEMMPTWWWIQGVQKLFSGLDFYAGQYGRGGERTTFSNGRVTTGVGICYESIYGEYFSGFAARGARLLTVITNDGWWGDTPGYRQHFNFARLRAIETRRWVARSANTGRSGFINARGDVVASLGWNRRGVITADLPLNDRQTFYTRFGDCLARLALLVYGLSMLYVLVLYVRRKI